MRADGNRGVWFRTVPAWLSSPYRGQCQEWQPPRALGSPSVVPAGWWYPRLALPSGGRLWAVPSGVTAGSSGMAGNWCRTRQPRRPESRQ